jgi:hypothetical protein
MVSSEEIRAAAHKRRDERKKGDAIDCLVVDIATFAA